MKELENWKKKEKRERVKIRIKEYTNMVYGIFVCFEMTLVKRVYCIYTHHVNSNCHVSKAQCIHRFSSRTPKKKEFDFHILYFSLKTIKRKDETRRNRM